MALVIGTNCGFVESAPIADPEGASMVTVSGKGFTYKDTSAAGVTEITEIGWWCDDASSETNFEMGIYAADGGSGEAGTRLHLDNTNAKGTDAGWKVVVGLNWAISESTDYWLGLQVDTTGTANVDYNAAGGAGFDFKTLTSLPDPFSGGSVALTVGKLAIYAVYEEAPATGSIGGGPYVY